MEREQQTKTSADQLELQLKEEIAGMQPIARRDASDGLHHDHFLKPGKVLASQGSSASLIISATFSVPAFVKCASS